MRSLSFLAVLLFALPAMAQTAPSGCGRVTGRMAVVPYQEHTLYECFVSPDVATAIIVEGDEEIGPTGAADVEGFDFRRDHNAIFVQPKSSEVNRSPNLAFVGKLKDGSTRNYFFLFHVSGYGGLAAIEFTYGGGQRPGAGMVAQAAYQPQPAYQPAYQAAQYQSVLPDPPRQDLVAATLRTAPFYCSNPSKDAKKCTNWQYSCMCDAGRDIMPDGFSDNGTDTIFEYRGNRSSAIVVARLDRNGTEKPGELPKIETVVTFTPLSANSNSFVVPQVAEYWKIRSGGGVSGGQVIAIRDDYYHPELHDLRTGSQSPYVVRVVKPTPAPRPPAAKAVTPAATPAATTATTATTAPATTAAK